MRDTLIFLCVDLWLRRNYRRDLRKLLERQKAYGLTRANVAVPQLANEKFLWRKIFDRDPRWGTVSDKAAAKEWIAEQQIDVRCPKTFWVGTNARDIPAQVWEAPFYLKATHGWQMNIAVPANAPNRDELIAEANTFMDQAHGMRENEWAYSRIPPRLIAEQIIAPHTELIEIKYYTYGPVVEQFIVRRESEQITASRWTPDETGCFVRSNVPTAISPHLDLAALPAGHNLAMDFAAQIGALFDHVRVDMFLDQGQVFLGELTVYNLSGHVYLNGDKRDEVQNRSWDLRRSWFLTTPQTGWRRIYANALRRRLNREAV